LFGPWFSPIQSRLRGKEREKGKNALDVDQGHGVKPREGEKGSGWSKKLRFRSGAAPPVLTRETTGTISWWRRSRRGSGLGRNVVLSTSAPSREQRHEDRGDGTRAVDESGGVFTEAFAMVGFLSEFAGMRDSVNTI